ncbi:NifU-like protein, putative involved in Fe-S cluster formation [Candidatus Phytoplasma mali]|uniref:NifU-like protein, putative involved in Fe-S cluster formation n=1 Tax=Phytoplasma mali (strain AT) TaxID=482235 RepID=B3R0D5_PHYMT|nr:SUF system NifU family Fe-S cluster assembly protein [Candidatus Phytoplasma mali]CAP18299.1 NifU-like protein, putative involved in Fe-S cluster formation [Candidatus Phytoplasma mali]
MTKFYEIYRNLILKYYHKKQNKILLSDSSYFCLKHENPFCGDDYIFLQIKVKSNMIIDFRYEIKGCVICISSANFMSNELKNKHISEVIKISNNFINMLKGKKFNLDNINSDFQLFQFLVNIKSRVNCAILSWEALLKLLKNVEFK